MRIAIAVVAAVLLLGCQSMRSSEGAKAEIAAATQAWIDGMTRHDIEGVVALYDEDAVLWGTRSPTLRDNPATVREYFTILRTVPPSYKAVLGEQRIRIYGDMAINTGTYTFSEIRDGKEIVRPARYSFVYRNRNGRWLIVDHHSSAVPAQP
ncbi:MAG TPA: SgcJ/EcaC family oxidoreductase [Casimicrobiaceae bacterium]|jgi:uncharacterized protein (TIGR02246 family)